MNTLSTVDALAGVAGHDIAVREMPEIAVDHPAVVDDEVAAFGEALDRQDRAIAQAVLAVFGFPTRREANAIAHAKRQRQRGR